MLAASLFANLKKAVDSSSKCQFQTSSFFSNIVHDESYVPTIQTGFKAATFFQPWRPAFMFYGSMRNFLCPHSRKTVNSAQLYRR
jgi:hypothetical protein